MSWTTSIQRVAATPQSETKDKGPSMLTIINDGLLIAQMDLFRNLGAGFRGRSAQFGTSDFLTVIAVLAALGIGMYVLSRVLQRQELPQRSNSPRVLFRELCLAHDLDRNSRRFLRQIGRYQRLDHLGRLFLEPERFEPANLSPKLRKNQALLQTLRQKLFGDLTFAEQANPKKPSARQSGIPEAKPASAKNTISPVVSGDGAFSADSPASV